MRERVVGYLLVLLAFPLPVDAQGNPGQTEEESAEGDSSGVEGQDETQVMGEELPALKARAVRGLEAALASLPAEPALAELKAAALSYAEADVAGARNWMGAVRAAAALPVLKFVAEQDLERDESLDRYQDEPDRWGADTDRDLGFQVSVQWNLPELIFNPDMVRVYGALAARADRRESVLTILVGYYYERRKLQLERALGPALGFGEEIDREMRIDELTALIDALTGGLLSRHHSKKPAGRYD